MVVPLKFVSAFRKSVDVETTSARALTTQLFRQGPRMSRAEALQATMKWMIDEAEFVDGESGKIVFSYAHPIFWAPFTLVGDGGGAAATEARNPMIN